MSISALIAIIIIGLIIAFVGYVLTTLAQPAALGATQTNSTQSNVHKATDAEVSSTLPEAQLIEEINRRLPQTQCAQCGHPGCRPYAEAIIRDHAPINQCPPGGDGLITELAEFLGTDALPLNNDKGETKAPQVALIVEPDCIGCALCIAACPVDAIVGAARYMHTVISDQCTGCELCLPPCPVDCIELHPVDTPLHRWQWPKPA